ncbi:MAG: DinB family protein, partial [Bdellovibrionales bacterium]|nr:DinB family protein [Bdellovibrionales bacterium]
MDGKAAIKIVLDTGSLILSAYLADFNTQELLLRPHPEANQIAWQLGHLVVNERRCLKALSESHAVPMSEEFLQAHGGTGEQDFVAEEQYSKEHYLALMNQQRSLTLGYLDSLSTDQLTNP